MEDKKVIELALRLFAHFVHGEIEIKQNAVILPQVEKELRRAADDLRFYQVEDVLTRAGYELD